MTGEPRETFFTSKDSMWGVYKTGSSNLILRCYTNNNCEDLLLLAKPSECTTLSVTSCQTWDDPFSLLKVEGKIK